ncbi:hypothetical protein AR457_38345 [Streptomyces agglomeratus]|uniref:hypothetical protein n=1 Tax=Streptomyces agglomeratus TaxID=285458 RepID=UPI000854845A|nr:hypothetical protein [Streptomyces agglomeratus]OEJ23057.1 hypothetical protein AR457_38345 [Streptomyces agglomeratus]
MVMARHLYASAPVVDGLPLLEEPGFWAAHLAELCEGLPLEDFGVDAADAGAALERLENKAAWPVFTVPLAESHSIIVHYNSGEQYTSTDYFLVHPDWRWDLVLASTDQDRIGPGLCWPELAALLPSPPGAAGVTDPHARLLLLLPVLGDANVPAQAVPTLMDALRTVGAPDDCEALARQLLRGHPLWGTSSWSYDHDERGWTCDGEHSGRSAPVDEGLPDTQRAALERCLTPGT